MRLGKNFRKFYPWLENGARRGQRSWKPQVRAGVLAVGILLSSANAASLGPGAQLDTISVGKVIYRHVIVRSVNARTLVFAYDGGMASVALKNLPTELQQAFGYSAAKAADADAALTAAGDARQHTVEQRRNSTMSSSKAHSNRFDEMLASFGTTPEIRTEVDMRDEFRSLSLGIKNQGPRPSCAVFTIVGALEFQNARLAEKAEQFSEEYLIWATSKILNRPINNFPANNIPESDSDGAATDVLDMGFTLTDVVTALRTYGVPLASELPYHYSSHATIDQPPDTIIAAAKAHNRASVIALPGPTPNDRLKNVIQALNHDCPVPIGVAWPSWRALRTAFINAQVPSGGGHAVCLVGYTNKTGAVEDTTFIFRNSWGMRWGTGGYGFITYRYLAQNLAEAVVLDLAPNSAEEPTKR